jgi:hypothetical protein
MKWAARRRAGAARSAVQTRTRAIWFPALSTFLKIAVATVLLNAAVAEARLGWRASLGPRRL